MVSCVTGQRCWGEGSICPLPFNSNSELIWTVIFWFRLHYSNDVCNYPALLLSIHMSQVLSPAVRYFFAFFLSKLPSFLYWTFSSQWFQWWLTVAEDPGSNPYCYIAFFCLFSKQPSCTYLVFFASPSNHLKLVMHYIHTCIQSCLFCISPLFC